MTTWNEVKDDPNFIKILDHGFVGLLDHMGSDSDIAAAARTSYGKGTKTVRDDEKLIRYLVKHDHSSPIEMGELKFMIKVPMFVARQIIRHRTSNINEVSARYSVLPNEIYIPDLENIMPQSVDNKQGRAGVMNINDKEIIRNELIEKANDSYSFYEMLINEDNFSIELEKKELGLSDAYSGIAREIARTVLPVGTYTQFIWKQDLRNLLHLLKLRLDPHAQYEIRVMAQAMYDLVQPLFPATVQAYDDYVRNSIKVSSMERNILKTLLSSDEVQNRFDDMIEKSGGLEAFLELNRLSKREFNEFKKEWGLN